MIHRWPRQTQKPRKMLHQWKVPYRFWGSCNKHEKITPEPSKIRPGTSPDPPKSRPGVALGAQIRPGGAPDQPRGAREAFKRAQEPPKSPQKPAKWRPRAAQDSPGPLQNRARRAPKRVFSTIPVGSCARQAPPAIFCRFLPCATSL